MKQLFHILPFILIATSIIGQTDSLICGEYTCVEEKGLHYVPGFTLQLLDGTFVSGTPYVSHVDTTITHELSLELNHNVVLQIDTLVGAISFLIVPERKLLGQWQLENDTLYMTFSETLTSWPFYQISKAPTPIIEKLPAQITQKLVIESYDNQLYRLVMIQEELIRIYVKG
jgi:hypothetical protein